MPIHPACSMQLLLMFMPAAEHSAAAVRQVETIVVPTKKCRHPSQKLIAAAGGEKDTAIEPKLLRNSY